MRAAALYRAAVADLDMVMDRDPSMLTRSEALLHPAIIAIWGYRIAHRVHLAGHRRTARVMSNVARLASGSIEIHPGAVIGSKFFVDHGAGVVIGETAIIGDEVTIFHQVTLGSMGWWREEEQGTRRHPKIGDRVVIGANASVLGPITVGAGSFIGAQSLVRHDIPAGSRVSAATGSVREIAVAAPSAGNPRPAFRAPKSVPRLAAVAGASAFPAW